MILLMPYAGRRTRKKVRSKSSFQTIPACLESIINRHIDGRPSKPIFYTPFRTYSKKTQLAIWQTDMSFCSWKVKKIKNYAHGRRLLDLVDLHIMDYLIGNQDRHHYESFDIFKNDIPSYAIHLDNGRSYVLKCHSYIIF